MQPHFLITFLLLSIYSGTLKPCNCLPYSSISEEVRESELVASGKVINISRKSLYQTASTVDSLGAERNEIIKPKMVYEYVIRLDRTYKGISNSDTIVIRTAIDPVTDCGLILDLDRIYIFYIHYASRGCGFYDERDKELCYTTTSCSRTKLFDKQEENEILEAIWQADFDLNSKEWNHVDGDNCCFTECCNRIELILKQRPAAIKKIYDSIRELNMNHRYCCRNMLHRIQLQLMDSLPNKCSVKKLFSIFGTPDRVSKHLTYLERRHFDKKLGVGKRLFKKVYRYEGTTPGRIYLFFIVRFGRVIYKGVYVDIC